MGPEPGQRRVERERSCAPAPPSCGYSGPAMAMRRTKLRIAVLAVLAAVIAVAASSSAFAGAQHVAKAPVVQTKNVKGLGVILVNGSGRTLYMFKPDKQKRVTCKGQCAAIWPPMKLKAGQKATAAGAAKKSLLGSDPNPSGGGGRTDNRRAAP